MKIKKINFVIYTIIVKSYLQLIKQINLDNNTSINKKTLYRFQYIIYIIDIFVSMHCHGVYPMLFVMFSLAPF